MQAIFVNTISSNKKKLKKHTKKEIMGLDQKLFNSMSSTEKAEALYYHVRAVVLSLKMSDSEKKRHEKEFRTMLNSSPRAVQFIQIEGIMGKITLQSYLG